MDALLPIKKDISITKIIENNFTDVG